MSDTAPACRNSDCRVAITGKCDLNHDPVDSCEEYGAAEAALDPGQEDEQAVVTESLTRLRSSELLPPDQLWPLRKAVSTTTVALVGEFRAGKTTLIAALYASFCKGALGEYSFRSSRTLTGFARRHHDALLQSKRKTPVTLRTSRQDGLSFFHLNVQDRNRCNRHLLIADRSGETYADARADTSLIDGLVELKLADRICFLLDSGRLADVEERQAYKRAFKQQIWAFLDNGALSPSTAIEMVSTKLDKLTTVVEERSLMEELVEFEAATLAEFADASLTARRVCALPRADYQVGLIGLSELLEGWLAPPPRPMLRLSAAVGPVRQLDRLFEYWSEA